jgi:hypothetical protein
MRKFLQFFSLFFLLPFTVSFAGAAPFLACDTEARATHSSMQFCTSINTATNPPTCNTWGVWGPDTAVIASATPAIDLCNHDLSAVPVGVNVVRVKAIDTNSAWTGGREESAPSNPFAFTRPASLTSPVAIRLAP